MSFGGAKNARARGNQIRHGLLILQQARLGKTSIPNLGARLPDVRSLCSARPAVKLAAANASIPDLGARLPSVRFALLGTSRRKVGCRQRLDPQSRGPAALRA